MWHMKKVVVSAVLRVAFPPSEHRHRLRKFCRALLLVTSCLASSLGLIGCVEMAMQRDINRLDEAYRAGRIPRTQYLSRRARMEQDLTVHQAEVTRIMKQAQYQYGPAESDNHQGMRYVQTGAHWQPRDAQYQQDSGQRYTNTGAAWQPRDAQYQQDSGQRYVGSGAQWKPRDPGYQQDSGQRYEATGANWQPKNPPVQNDSGLRYVSTATHPPQASSSAPSDTRYIQDRQSPSASGGSKAGQTSKSGTYAIGNPAAVLEDYARARKTLEKTHPHSAACIASFEKHVQPQVLKMLLGGATPKFVAEWAKSKISTDIPNWSEVKTMTIECAKALGE